MTLVELLIAVVISLVVTLAMVSVMANTLGTGTETIRMTRLTQEMRTAMHIMSRELRRANFYYGAVNCYANVNCTQGAGVAVIQPAGNDCFEYWYERDVGAPTSGAFGRFGTVLRMNLAGGCDSVDGWLDITDPGVIDVTGFQLLDVGYSESISDTDTQWVNRMQITLGASLKHDFRGVPTRRTLQDYVFVRNNVLCPAGVCP